MKLRTIIKWGELTEAGRSMGVFGGRDNGSRNCRAMSRLGDMGTGTPVEADIGGQPRSLSHKNTTLKP